MNVASNDHSSALKQQLSKSGSLLSALDAVSNWRAFILLASTFVISVMLAVAFGALTAFLASKASFMGGLSALIAFLVVGSIGLVGVNATGIMLADDVWDRTPRGIADSLLASVFTSHRLVLILLIEVALFLIYLTVLVIFLLACKIPGIGPMLYAFVFPIGTIITGILIFSLTYIAIPLASPAVWNGVGVKRALVMLKEVARTRLLHVVVMMLLLGILITFAVGIVFLVIFSGTGVVVSLSALVVGFAGEGFQGIARLFMGDGGEGSGYILAFGFGSAALALVGCTPGVLIGIKGASIIYRDVTSDLSLDVAEEEINRQIEEVKRRAEEARQRATPTQPVVQMQPSSTFVATCPRCNGPIKPGDVFCGNCGHKLN